MNKEGKYAYSLSFYLSEAAGITGWEEERRRLLEEDDYMKFVAEAIAELQTQRTP
ncbi:MAG: hypothetical protein WB053_14055 [Nitrososphaeraceae archaeon]